MTNFYDADALIDWATSALRKLDVPEADALGAATLLIRTSLRGIDTHGITRVPTYLDRLRNQEVNPRAQPRLDVSKGVLHVDGDGGLGHVVAPRAVARAVELARTNAMVPCVIRNCGHLAALGIFVLQAAAEGMVALLCQHTPPVMALPGATARAIGNNPLAFTMPVPDDVPLVFDMASSVVAYGHVAQALRDRLDAIPIDWAIGADGQPTSDPAKVRAMQPVGGHKGIGLAMMVECLAASLSGHVASMTDAVASQSFARTCAFLAVVNPDHFVPREVFDASVIAWLKIYLQASGPTARYPGSRQAASESRRRIEGIPVPASVVEELRAAGDKVGCPFDLSAVKIDH